MVRYSIEKQTHGPSVHLRNNRYQKLRPRRNDLPASFLLRQNLNSDTSRLAMVTDFDNYHAFSRFYGQVNEEMDPDLGVVTQERFETWQLQPISEQHIVENKVLLELFNIASMNYAQLKRNHPELYDTLKEVQDDTGWSPVKRIAAMVAAGVFTFGLGGAIALPAAAWGLAAAVFGGTASGFGLNYLHQKILQPDRLKKKLENFSSTETEEIFDYCQRKYRPDARALVNVNAQLLRMALVYPQDQKSLLELHKQRADLETRLNGLNRVFDSVFQVQTAPRRGQVITYTDDTKEVLSFLNRLHVGYDAIPVDLDTQEDKMLDLIAEVLEGPTQEEGETDLSERVQAITKKYRRNNSERNKTVSDRHRRQNNRERTPKQYTLKLDKYPTLEASDNFEPGEMLGNRYVLQGLIGRGGVGEVWLARDKDSEKEVAIKLSNGKNPAVFKGDIKRARGLRKIDNQHIVSILDTNEETPLYIAEQLVPGTDLRSLIENNTLPIPAAMKIAKDILGAVSVPHEWGIFHRDLKPANVMIQPNGRIVLLDFGTVEELGTKMEMSGDLLSEEQGATTPVYIAPELWLPGKHKIGAKVDVYSTGAILFEMLTGKVPVGLQTPSDWNKEVPRSLDKLVKEMMMQDPEHRIAVSDGVKRLHNIIYTLSPEAAIKVKVKVPKRNIEPIIIPDAKTPEPGYVEQSEIGSVYNQPETPTVVAEVQPEAARVPIKQAIPIDGKKLLEAHEQEQKEQQQKEVARNAQITAELDAGTEVVRKREQEKAEEERKKQELLDYSAEPDDYTTDQEEDRSTELA